LVHVAVNRGGFVWVVAEHAKIVLTKYVDANKDAYPALNSGFVPAAHLSQEQKEAVASILGLKLESGQGRGGAMNPVSPARAGKS